MDEKEILEHIQRVYNEVTGQDDLELKPGTRFKGKEEISSLVLVELVTCLEDEFDINLKYSDIKSLKTVRGLTKLIKEQI